MTGLTASKVEKVEDEEVKNLVGKTYYLPYMCDHAYMLAAAMRNHGRPAEVLDEPDEESLAIGQELCLGRECLPCFVCVGDVLKRSRRPDFDPARSVLLMPTTAGPCRFGQYSALHREIMNEMGLGEMEIVSPTAANSYRDFGDRPTQLRRLAWQGIVGVDLLQKLTFEHRPYEVNVGEADAIYHECLDALIRAVEDGGGRRSVAVMEMAARKFRALPIDRTERRPIIGVVGEIYLRVNAFTNQDIVRKVEALGGEVWVAPMMEWLYFTNVRARDESRLFGDYLELLKISVTDWVQRRDEHKMLRPVEDLLLNAHETPVDRVLENDRPYYDPELGTEAVLTIGKAVDYARLGVSGIINIMPFTCMPGIITSGLASKIRENNNQIPWLDVIYDAQGETNINTRLEAFMYQARQYRRRMGGDGANRPM